MPMSLYFLVEDLHDVLVLERPKSLDAVSEQAEEKDDGR